MSNTKKLLLSSIKKQIDHDTIINLKERQEETKKCNEKKKSMMEKTMMEKSMMEKKMQQYMEQYFKKKKKEELVSICKEKGISYKGNKFEIVLRLIEFEKNKGEEVKQKQQSQLDTLWKVSTKNNHDIKCKNDNDDTRCKKNEKSGWTSKNNIKRGQEKYPLSQEVISIFKNIFGNYVHPLTNLVFSPLSQKVIGIEDEEGNVKDLQRKDLELCKKWKFPYEYPAFLNEADKDDYMYEILLQEPTFTSSHAIEEEEEGFLEGEQQEIQEEEDS